MRTPKAKGAAAPSTCKQKVKAKASPGRSNNKGASTPSPQQTEPAERSSTPNTRASAKQCKVSDINSKRSSVLFDEDESKSLKRSRQGMLFTLHVHSLYLHVHSLYLTFEVKCKLPNWVLWSTKFGTPGACSLPVLDVTFKLKCVVPNLVL